MAGEAAQRLLELALLGAVTRREPAVLVCQSPAAAAAAWRGTGARFAAAGLAVARLEAADRSGGAVWPEAQVQVWDCRAYLISSLQLSLSPSLPLSVARPLDLARTLLSLTLALSISVFLSACLHVHVCISLHLSCLPAYLPAHPVLSLVFVWRLI